MNVGNTIKIVAAVGVLSWALKGFFFGDLRADHLPSVVMRELVDLDIRKQPGEPGSTAESAGGVLPDIRLKRSGNRLEWIVMSGDKVATRMIATVSESWRGGSTISAEVVRGDAPDQLTSPAFRSLAITLSLFRNALEEEVALIGSVGWGPECDALRNEIVHGDGGVMSNPLKLATFHEELREMGCDVNAEPKDFKTVTTHMDRDPVDEEKGPPPARPTGFQTASPF